MAKLVTKWRYLKPDAARHAQAYIRYIATREGVEKYVEENGARPAVQAQRVLVEKLLRDFPDARRSFEYEDYARRPTVRNASEFITRTLEEHLELFDARSNYVSYIAQRPRVQRSGAHGLFTQEEDAPDLNAAARAVSEHDGNIWTCILSLRREDAARLSYDKADAWRALLRANAAEIAVPDQMDLRRRLLNPRKLLFVVIYGKVHPTHIIIPRAVLFDQLFLRAHDGVFHVIDLRPRTADIPG